MVGLFGGKSNDLLSSLRYITTAEALVTSEHLPPISTATSLYSQRVYSQIIVWMRMANEMNPTDWGWKQENGQLIPIMTEKNAAHDKLFENYPLQLFGRM